LKIGPSLPTLRSQTISSSLWSGIEAFAGQGISFAVFFILARLLSPSDFGLIALANIYVLVVQYLIFQGLGQAILQFEDLDEEHLSTIFWLHLALGVLFCGLTFVAGGWVSVWFGAPGLSAILQMMTPIFLLAALTDVQNNLLGRRMNFKSLALRTLVSSAVGGVVGIGMAVAGFGVWSFVGQQVATWVINLAILWTASEWRPRFFFSQTKAGQLLRFGSNLLWVDLVGLASRRVDQLFVGRFFGASALGFYAVGSRVSSLVGEVMIRSLSRVSVSGLSRLQHDAARFTQALYAIFELQIAVILPVAIGAALLAGDVVRLFFGAQWEAAVPVMQVLLLAAPFEAMSAVHCSALISRGQPRWCSLLTTGHAVVNLLLCWLAASHGPTAVAVAVAVRAALLYPLEVIAVKRVVPLSGTRVFKELWPLFAATLLMALGVSFVSRLFGETGPLSLRLTAAVATGAAIYTAALTALKPRLAQEIWSYRRFLWLRANETTS